MIDQPYGLDMFNKITDIHFGGGPWVAVQFFFNTSDNVTISIDFPDEAGGTPGYPVLDHSVFPAKFVSAPFGGAGVHVQKSYLAQKLTTSAGSSFNGWGIKDAVIGHSGGGFFYLQAGTGIIQARQKFRLRVRFTSGGPNIMVATVDFVQKNAMKVGAISPLPTMGAPAFVSTDHPQFIDVICDPVALTAVLA